MGVVHEGLSKQSWVDTAHSPTTHTISNTEGDSLGKRVKTRGKVLRQEILTESSLIFQYC